MTNFDFVRPARIFDDAAAALRQKLEAIRNGWNIRQANMADPPERNATAFIGPLIDDDRLNFSVVGAG